MKGSKLLRYSLSAAAVCLSILPSLVAVSGGRRPGAAEFTALAVFIVMLAIYVFSRNEHINSGKNISAGMTDIKISAYNDMPMPSAIVDKNGQLIKYNSEFISAFALKHRKSRQNIREIMQIDLEQIAEQNISTVYNLRRIYRVFGVKYGVSNEEIMVLYFHDDTDYVSVQQRMINSKPCIMLISIDNYADALQSAKESEKTRISAQVEQLLDEYVGNNKDTVIFKMSKDSFTVLMKEYNLRDIVSGKFKILDEARLIKTSTQNNITLSIGVAFDGETFTDSLELAKQSLDMALGRGGDQAAVKSDGGYRFFGGVSKGVEKKSRTKTRAVASAMKDLIRRSDKVYIMGHSYSDPDSVGSACGMAGAIRLLGKESYVVLRKKTTLALPLVESMMKSEMPVRFIEPEFALDNVTDETLLVIVDTHNKKILESEELYRKARQVVVIDHHRKIVDYIDNAVIFYHEPFASSASELVTELVQYFELNPVLSPDYSNALLSGIMTDTKNFVMQTGVRTFEAAAYLRKIGADTVKVINMTADSLAHYQLRSKVVSEAEFYKGCAVSSAGKSDISELRIIASQAADQLLTIKNVRASFVIYEMNDVVNISARSFGEINVQVLMEQLGGGGHQTMAAAQLKNVTSEEAKKLLIGLIEKMSDEGEN